MVQDLEDGFQPTTSRIDENEGYVNFHEIVDRIGERTSLAFPSCRHTTVIRLSFDLPGKLERQDSNAW